MDQINDVHGSSNAPTADPNLEARQTLTLEYTKNAWTAHLVMMLSLAGFLILNVIGATWYGLIIATILAFDLWFWFPKARLAYIIYKSCSKRDSAK